MQMSHLVAGAIGALMLATTAHAQTPPPEGPPEARGQVFVTPMGQPFRAAPDSHRAPILLWLAHADTDGDQRISRDEFVNEAMVFYANVLDANHDRAVTPIESTAFWRTQAPEMLNIRTAPVAVTASRRVGDRSVLVRPDDQGPRGRGPQRQDQSRQQITLGADVEPVMSCDRDFSRRVDAAEFQTCAERRFLALDVNRDGYFTLYESERAREMLADDEQYTGP